MPEQKKVLILGGSHLSVFGFRGELIERLISEKFDITTAFPSDFLGAGEVTSKEYGCHFIETPMQRRGKNPFREAALFCRYRKLIRKVKPDVVLSYTIKCNLYGGILCRIFDIPLFPNITGLGTASAEGGVIQKITTMLYRIALKSAECVFFQNEQDRDFFVQNGIKCRKEVVLPGSGVNLQRYTPLRYPKGDRIIFFYIARVMKAKGIEEFLDAARKLRKEFANVEFHICGYYEEAYKQIITGEEREGNVVYHGFVSDVRDYIKMSSCVVLPTYYMEGVPNSLLEAAACARPVITTDRAGCRDVVDDGITGYLIRERDSGDLIAKMKAFIRLGQEERERMGIAGRKKMEDRFDRQIIVEEYLKALGSI